MLTFLQAGRLKRMLTGGLAVCVVGVLAMGATASAASVQRFTPGHQIEPTLAHTVSQRQSQSLATAAFTHFTSTVTTGGITYTYTMAGKNPAKPVTNAASSIGSFVIPTVIQFQGTSDVWDPTVVDSCDAGASALTRTVKSPIFVKEAWNWGGTSIGTGQVTDAFQRAEFWSFANPSGVNPTYAVNLGKKVLTKLTITVPLADAAAANISCGNGLLGAVNFNWLDPFLQQTVIPSLASAGVSPKKLPIFLLHNVVSYQGTTSNCCILGYHNAYNTSTGVQTYAVAMYDNSSAFSGSHDISALSHEIGEWMDDPYVNNPTPAWGHIGQVSGCQGNLEVGDPLSGTTFANTINGFTYHPQELAFFSWFYHQNPSLGVNGWYSDQGTFTTFAANCT
jgi:hypothetical protein